MDRNEDDGSRVKWIRKLGRKRKGQESRKRGGKRKEIRKKRENALIFSFHMINHTTIEGEWIRRMGKGKEME